MIKRTAAVAVVVAAGDAGDELLVVRRATYPGDPWSGHIALPGGGVEPGDTSLEDTARRETLEETGVDLGSSQRIAILGAVTPKSRGAPLVSVAPFVFRYDGDKRVTMSDEIVDAWWIPIAELEQPEAWRVTKITTTDGHSIEARAFQLRGYVLWGLTERIIDEFLAIWRLNAGH
jgi:8-oxo-dGTP pyrophosphatase MutT (NUDIX family)